MTIKSLQLEYVKLMKEADTAVTRKEAIDCIQQATKILDVMKLTKLLDK
jgi:hypothetical protein